MKEIIATLAAFMAGIIFGWAILGTWITWQIHKGPAGLERVRKYFEV